MIQSKVLNSAYVEHKVQQATKAVKKISPDVLAKGIVVYTQVASRQMPPPVKGAKSRSIPAKLYKRAILPIGQAIKKDKKHRKQLIFQAKKGMKFVVYGYYKLSQKRWYATTLRNAKKYQRIQYRGLYKWLWGSQLASIGEKTPTMFTRLLSKSPKMISKKNLVKMTKKQVNNETMISLDYQASRIDYFASWAKVDAARQMKKRMKKLFQSGVSNAINNIKQ